MLFLRKLLRTPVIFNDAIRTEPVSRLFGLDRGTAIDRYYIEGFLARNAGLIGGAVLEVGDSGYTRRFGGTKVGSSMVLNKFPNENADIVGDLSSPKGLPQDAFDCFVCTQTLNFIFDLPAAVKGIYCLLKPGGVVLATVAGISQISRYDMEQWGDYWRLTSLSLERLFKPVFGEQIKVESHGNMLAACALLQGLSVEDLPQRHLLDDNDPDYQVIITIVARKGHEL